MSIDGEGLSSKEMGNAPQSLDHGRVEGGEVGEKELSSLRMERLKNDQHLADLAATGSRKASWNPKTGVLQYDVEYARKLDQKNEALKQVLQETPGLEEMDDLLRDSKYLTQNISIAKRLTNYQGYSEFRPDMEDDAIREMLVIDFKKMADNLRRVITQNPEVFGENDAKGLADIFDSLSETMKEQDASSERSLLEMARRAADDSSYSISVMIRRGVEKKLADK